MPKSNRKPAPSYKGSTRREVEPPKAIGYLASQKKWLLQTLVLSVAGFIVLKYCFPLPDIDQDGVNYVSWAYTQQKVGYRPLGYPQFLTMLHNVSGSIYAVAPVQYLLHVVSVGFAFFSIDYLFKMPPRLKQILIVVAFLNPLLLFQANTISSDSVFCSLTILMLTLCVWFGKTGDLRFFIFVVAVLYFCLAVRLTALFYPFLLLVAILLSRKTPWTKVACAATVVAVVVGFVQNQKNVVWEVTKASVFSGFSGWQMANNALYCYKNIKVENSDLPTPELRTIDNIVKQQVDSVKTTCEVGDAYLWDKRSPLRKYASYKATINKEKYFFSWFKVSEDLNSYGWYIARNYPLPFAKYYLYPNFKRFLYPEAAPIDKYNSANAKLPPEVGIWFGQPSLKLECRYPEVQKKAIAIYPPLTIVLHLFNVITMIFFVIMAIPVRKTLPHCVWVLFLTWTGYYFAFAAFSVFASAVYLRFLDAVFALSPVFTGVLLREAILLLRAKPKIVPEHDTEEMPGLIG